MQNEIFKRRVRVDKRIQFQPVFAGSRQSPPTKDNASERSSKQARAFVRFESDFLLYLVSQDGWKSEIQ